MVQPDILIFQPFCIFILVISPYRIFQDSFRKIQAAVTMDITAHQLVHPLLFHLIQIGFAKIQFYISMGFFQCFRRHHLNLVLCLPFFLHLLGHIGILHACRVGGQLLHVAFQSILVHFLGKIIPPVKFCQILYGDSKNLLKSCLLGKIRIRHFIIYGIDHAD